MSSRNVLMPTILETLEEFGITPNRIAGEFVTAGIFIAAASAITGRPVRSAIGYALMRAGFGLWSIAHGVQDKIEDDINCHRYPCRSDTDNIATANIWGMICVGGAFAVLLPQFGEAYMRSNYPENEAQQIVLQKAGAALMGGEERVQLCESVNGFKWFDDAGQVIGQQCATLTVVQRDGMNFIADVKWSGEKSGTSLAKPTYRQAFRPSGVDEEHVPKGYEGAFVVTYPPAP